jgi:hypothetical protein
VSDTLTFRDFAGAIMSGDRTKAASVLATLLALPAPAAEAATAHFAGRMTDPAFMPKAMSLRTAVQSGSDAELATLLGDCFGLDDPATAIGALRARYPRPAQS